MRISNDPPIRDEPAPATAGGTLLLGIGNTLLRDEGLGVRIVEDMRNDPAAAAAVLIDGGTLSFSLLPYFEGLRALVAVDAADLKTAAGTVRMFEGDAMDQFVRRTGRRSVHEVGLADLLDMTLLHGCLPKYRAVVCVQPQIIDWGWTLSPAVRSALPRALAEIRALLRRWPP